MSDDDSMCATLSAPRTCRSPLMLTSLALTRATRKRARRGTPWRAPFVTERHRSSRCRTSAAPPAAPATACSAALLWLLCVAAAACGRRLARGAARIFRPPCRTATATRNGPVRCQHAAASTGAPSSAFSSRARTRPLSFASPPPTGLSVRSASNATRRGRRRPVGAARRPPEGASAAAAAGTAATAGAAAAAAAPRGAAASGRRGHAERRRR